MKIIIENTYEEMSQVAATMLLGKMYQNKKRVNVSITAGSTPKKMYEYLIPLVKDRDYLNNVYYHNFDEIPVGGQEYGVTLTNLNTMFFEPAGIDKKQIVALNEKNYETHMETIRQSGGLEFMVMGLGADGHFCGNLPNTSKFEDEMAVVTKDATPTMKDVLLSEVGGDASKMPDYYVTMGPRGVMETKEIVMIVNGKHKAEIVKQLVEGPVTPDVPASILKLHPNFILILDKDAASLL